MILIYTVGELILLGLVALSLFTDGISIGEALIATSVLTMSMKLTA
jgi:hypothetical protein